jgi:hypothetical protein
MKRGNLKKVVTINSELESIDRKILELNNLEQRVTPSDREVTLCLKVEGVPGIYEIKKTFTQSDLILITDFRKIKLSERKQELEKELEEL